MMRPEEIERASMAIIGREMGDWAGPAENLPVLKRVIHTTADFDFVRNLLFSPNSVRLGREALRRGVTVVTDTAMAAAGIGKPAAARWGVSVVCRMADPEVGEEARRRGVTRAVVCMERAVEATPDAVFAIGNAPTALFEVLRMVREEGIRPACIVGIPVGFVGAADSKELLAKNDKVPYITVEGTKGGSPIAASAVNAVMYLIDNTR